MLVSSNFPALLPHIGALSGAQSSVPCKGHEMGNFKICPENSFSARLSFPSFSHRSISFAPFFLHMFTSDRLKKCVQRFFLIVLKTSVETPEWQWTQFVTGSSDAVLWLRFCHDLPAGPTDKSHKIKNLRDIKNYRYENSVRTRKESKVIQVWCPSKALRKRTKKLIQLILERNPEHSSQLRENLQDLSRQGTGRTRNSNPGMLWEPRSKQAGSTMPLNMKNLRMLAVWIVWWNGHV